MSRGPGFAPAYADDSDARALGIAFALPQRRKDAYVSRMRTIGGKAVVVRIAECQILSLKPLGAGGGASASEDGDAGGSDAPRAVPEGGGYLLKVALPADSAATDHLAALDAEAERTGAEKNAAWFRNNLSPDDMRAMFRASVGAPAGPHGARTACVLVSDVQEPRPLTLDGAPLDGAAALAELSVTASGRAQLRACQATCVLEAQGLYFYARRFGIRWRLRSLALKSPAALAEEAAATAALTDDERRAIESQWAAEVAAYGARLDAAAAELRARKAEAAELLAAAAALPACAEREWNATLEALRRNIYSAGAAAPDPA